MPIHDWTKVEACVFHDFRHSWIEEVQRSLNSASLPSEFYAMAEQHAGPFGQDVLTLKMGDPASEETGVSGDLPTGAHVPLPLQVTYERDFAALPRRWRRVLEAWLN